jgi:hypothetical protein
MHDLQALTPKIIQRNDDTNTPRRAIVSHNTQGDTMKRTILTFGIISGILCSLLMNASLLFAKRIGYGHSMIVGYTIMVASFLLVYFGIRSYRDNVGNGHITFGRAFAIGISITLITCIFYVVSWEIMYFNFMPTFMDDYGAYELDKLKAAGATAAAIQAKTQELQHAKELYKDPLINSAMTFMEPFPVGLLITLISAALLRRKPQSIQSPLPASH